MGKSERRKGQVYENEVYNYLVEHTDHEVDKENRSGYDGGDLSIIQVVPGEVAWVRVIGIECKNQKRLDLAGYIDQAVANGDKAVIVKRRGRSDVGKHYVVMQVEDWLELL